LEDYVNEAIIQGFDGLGFSTHAPLPFGNKWSINDDDLINYSNEIIRFKNTLKDKLNIFLAMECDYIPGISYPFSHFKEKYKLDYIIGGVHLVKRNDNEKLWFIDGSDISTYDKGLKEIFEMNIKEAVTNYYNQVCEMITTQKPDIIAHLDKIKMNNKGRYFSEDENWYVDLTKQTVECIAKSNCIVEVNTRGIYKQRSDSLYPGIKILEMLLAKNIPITISSDAHKPEEISLYFHETIEILKGIGFKTIKVLEEKQWVDKTI